MSKGSALKKLTGTPCINSGERGIVFCIFFFFFLAIRVASCNVRIVSSLSLSLSAPRSQKRRVTFNKELNSLRKPRERAVVICITIIRINSTQSDFVGSHASRSTFPHCCRLIRVIRCYSHSL